MCACDLCSSASDSTTTTLLPCHYPGWIDHLSEQFYYIKSNQSSVVDGHERERRLSIVRSEQILYKFAHRVFTVRTRARDLRL